uniref:co-chaperone DjlA n=1 Tax=Succinivibrio sp. TaxID=2053619 RepID=UPI00402A7FEF
MKLTGTILGFLLGFIFGHNIVVAVVCALIGYFVFDKPRLEKNEKRQKAYNAFSKGANYNLALVDITFSFMGYIARGAGRINEEHIGSAYSVMEMMQLDENARKTAMTAFNAGKQPDFNIDAKVAELKAIIGDNDAFVDYILEIQIQVALSDGVLAKQEHDRLIILAASLGVSVQSMERLITIRYSEMMFSQRFRNSGYDYQQSSQENYQNDRNSSYESGYGKGNSEDESRSYNGNYSSQSKLDAAYKVLGIEKSASDDEVKKAHRRLMLKYHPDRLASQGLTEEMIRMYTEKAKDIQAAFDLIKKERGLK